MSRILSLMTLLLTLVSFAGQPTHMWDFTKQKNQLVPDTGSSQIKLDYKNRLKEEGALSCPTGSYRFISCPPQKLDWKELTVDVQFRLDSPLDKTARTLFSYENAAWRQKYLIFRINAKGQLEAEIKLRDKAVDILKYTITSDGIDILPNTWHNARLAFTSGGEGRLWLDAQLVASKKGALSLSDLDYQPAEWYPLICFGANPGNPRERTQFLRGSIAAIRMWDSIEAPNPLHDAPVVKSEVRDFSHALVTSIGETAEWTCPFMVLDSEGAAAGSTVTADEKFIRTAGIASAVLDGDDLLVTFRCAIAPGVDSKKVPGGSTWSGDAVEFFFRPDLSKPLYFHYGSGINGALYTARMTASRMKDNTFVSSAEVRVQDTKEEWQAQFRIPISEIGLDKTPGSVHAGNFTRSGPTSGGLQTWGPLSTDFHHPDSFPPMIIGSRKAYFSSRLSSARSELVSLNATAPDLHKKAATTLDELAGAIESNGNDRDWYSRIDKSFSNLKKLYISIALEGKPFLVWEPEDACGNSLDLSMLTKPLEKIRITMPRNSVTRKGMVFTNMTDTPFLGQIKCFEKWPMQLVAKAFSSEPWNQFLDGIRFAEGLPIMDSAKNIFYDPIAPLPMNTVVRTDANGTVPLWLTVSSKGLQPGTYTGQIVIKGAYPGFGTQVIALETKVIAADPEEYKGINMSFTYMMSPKAKASHARFLADHGMNTIYSSPPGYPEMNEDGTIGETDYSHFDANLRICFANGFDPKTCHVIFYMAMERKWAMLHKGKARFPYGTPQFEKAFKLFLLDLARHLEETFGITQEQLILYPCDEPGGEWDDPDDSMNIAWNAGNWIKDTLPKVRRFIDPYPFGPRRKKCSEETLNKIFGLFDIVMLHRPANVLPDVVAIAKKHNCTIWTYGIVDKVTHPAVYRRFFWLNLKDGLGSTAAFWHMDAQAGGDGFDSFDSHGYNPKSRADYGAIYTDWNYGTILSGRRFDAWCDGFTDYRLAQLCLQAIEALPDRDTRAKQLQSIFETASEGGINEMEAGRTKLLKLYEEIKK